MCIRDRYTCVKTIKAVTAMHARWFNKRPPSYTQGPVWQLAGKQKSGENTTAGMSITDRWPRFSAQADCTLSGSLLLSGDERNWATALSGSRRADYRLSQLRLCTRWLSTVAVTIMLPYFTSPSACGGHAAMRYWCRQCSCAVYWNERPWGTMTDRIANARKLNSN